MVNVQPEENCRIVERLKFEWMEFRSDWTEFRPIGRNSDLIGRNLELIGRNSELIERNVVKVLMPEKKSAWTDLDRVSFKKFVKESNVEMKNLHGLV